MVNIDYIMELLDWNRAEEDQKKGLELAKQVKFLYAFLQPYGNGYSKSIWDNCAKILAERSDEELKTYLHSILEWLQDMNWPGAFIILDRMRTYSKNEDFYSAFNYSLQRAKKTNDEIWETNLNEIIHPNFY